MSSKLCTKSEYHALIEEIRRHDYLYYIKCAPAISDHAYDVLLKRLEEVEKEHPEWVIPSSPTQRVGETLIGGFKQAHHMTPMLSLANTYSKEELEDFIKRVHKLVGRKEVFFCTELKMDGVAISVRYEQGIFTRALTRGDGKKGDDITANVKTIRSVPMELHGKEIPKEMEVRGEVFMTRKVFQEQNQRKEKLGEELWANPRNAAAGSLKLLDPKEVALRKLSIVFYGIGEGLLIGPSQFACHERLKELGLPVFEEKYRKRCKDIEEILHFAEKIQNLRSSFPFDIDGIVVKIDDLALHKELGATGKVPRWAVAYKFAPEQAKTRIKEITVQVGRTGVLTPVAELEPVLLAGSVISRATLHNEEEIERKDIRVGDYVIIEKGGDVIPKVVQVELSKRPPDTHSWKMPKKCPSCHTPVVRTEEEVAVRCPNGEKCLEQKVRKIAYFVSKSAMDIEHLGEKVVRQLVEKGLINEIPDIYALTEKDLAKLDGFKEKSIQNLLSSIERSKKVSLGRFILALGIKYVGEETAEALALYAQDIDALAKMKEEELEQIEGVGEKTAQAITEYFSEPRRLKEVHALFKQGVSAHVPKITHNKAHPFYGKTFVLTGALKNYTRTQAASLIKEKGGKVSESVSRKTDYVLVGEEAGSKLDKAHSLKIPLLNEEEFTRLLH